jgi:hypothetical protein
MLFQALRGRLRASALTLTGFAVSSRRKSFVLRPLPDQVLAGSGSVPGAHTAVEPWMPTT